jgi:hypothetical protein
MTKPILSFITGACVGFGCALLAIALIPPPAVLHAVKYLARDTQPHSTEDLALKLTPHVQQFLGDHREDFASRAGGPVERLAVRWGIPIAQRETPVVLEHGLDTLATELGTWSISDVMHWLASVAERKGEPPPKLCRELEAARP